VKALRSARARYFASRLKGWPRTDRREFGRLLVLFAESDHLRRHEQADNVDLAAPESGEQVERASDSSDADTPKHRSSRGAKRSRSA